MVRETHVNFDDVWKFITTRKDVPTIVQNRDELEHVFNLVKDCGAETYLEIGTAEGNTLYALGGLCKKSTFIDIGEEHCKKARDEIIDFLGRENVRENYCDSTYLRPLKFFKLVIDGDVYVVQDKIHYADVIMIDGGHDFATVLSDSIRFAHLAKKYIFWHDIGLPEVNAAFQWFKERYHLGRYYKYATGPNTNFGYGICEVYQ